MCAFVVLFHRGPAILSVDTRMRHLKPLQFIGLVFADAAQLSKSSACAHKKHWSFCKARKCTQSTRTRERRVRIVSLSVSISLPLFRFLFLYFPFFGCLSSPATITPQYSTTLKMILFSYTSTAAHPVKLGFVRKAAS